MQVNQISQNLFSTGTFRGVLLAFALSVYTPAMEIKDGKNVQQNGLIILSAMGTALYTLDRRCKARGPAHTAPGLPGQDPIQAEPWEELPTGSVTVEDANE